MKKIRILMSPSDLQGVGHFRSIWPAQSMEKHFSKEVEIEINHAININNIEYLKGFDIIHFHRTLGDYDGLLELSKKLHDAGVLLILDIDDYWEPPITHPLFEIVKRDKISEKIVSNLKLAHYITTTTDVFARHVKPINENVFVIPNALDMTHRMWKSEVQENQTDKCRISWIGGSSHLHDLMLVQESMIKLNNSAELENKYQFILCGFDTRGSITEMLPDGQRRTRPILPQETVWNQFEQIFTSNGKLIKDQDYLKWLSKIKREDYLDQYKKNYVRRWTLPLTQYGKHYDYCDVCLSPLSEYETIKTLPTGEIVSPNDQREGTISKRPHYFNEVKSELKVIESGMKKKVLIAQDFGAYKEYLKDGETGILVSDNKKGWYKALKQVILDKDYRESLANNLHEYVKEKYELKNVTEKRVEFYKDILEKHRANKFSRPIDKVQTMQKVETTPVVMKSNPIFAKDKINVQESLISKVAKRNVNRSLAQRKKR